MEIGVDDDGFIFLSFEAPDSTDKDVFKWSKNYGKAIEAGRARLENKNNRSGSVFLFYFLSVKSLKLWANPDNVHTVIYSKTALENKYRRQLTWII